MSVITTQLVWDTWDDGHPGSHPEHLHHTSSPFYHTLPPPTEPLARPLTATSHLPLGNGATTQVKDLGQRYLPNSYCCPEPNAEMPTGPEQEAVHTAGGTREPQFQ